MNVLKIIKDVEHSVMNHRAIELNKLVGKRFRHLDDIERELKEEVNIIQSDSERLINLDYMLDGEYSGQVEFTIFYLLDSDELMYITEVSF
jgi:hypothetical protein